MNKIYSYYYPTTVVFIDDSERFLTTISLQLDTRLAYVTFTDPDTALKYIKENSAGDKIINSCISEDIDIGSLNILPNEYGFKVNLAELHRQVYNSERFNETTVVVVDYSMPKMNGYDFCLKLKKNKINVQVILLTGEADEGKGIEMFNAGLINKFILKNSTNFGDLVNDSILELQKNYFEYKSNIIINSLNSGYISFIKEEGFIKTFNNICKKNDIVEYYLIEVTGSFIMLGFEGKPIWLIVCTDVEFEEYYDMAKDSGASIAVLKLLNDRKKIPYFKNPDEYIEAAGIQWEAYLHPVQKIQINNKNYYYSLVKDMSLFEIKRNNILSYKHYLEEVWPPI